MKVFTVLMWLTGFMVIYCVVVGILMALGFLTDSDPPDGDDSEWN